jgi:hypothetical protein
MQLEWKLCVALWYTLLQLSQGNSANQVQCYLNHVGGCCLVFLMSPFVCRLWFAVRIESNAA